MAVVVLLAGCAASCGARTGLLAPDLAPPLRDAGEGEARVVRGLCDWPPTREMAVLTDGPGRKRLGSLALGGDGVLVGWGFADTTAGDGAFRVQRVGYTGSVSDPTAHVVARGTQARGATLGVISLASSDAGHAAAISWTSETQCEFVPLGPDGSALGPSTRRAGGPCVDLRATADGRGYTLLADVDGPGARPALVALGLDGPPVTTLVGIDLPVATTAMPLRALATGGDFAFVGVAPDPRVGVFDAAGTPRTRAAQPLDPAATVREPRVVATETGYLAAWLALDARDPTRATVFAASITPQGDLRAPAAPVPDSAGRADPTRLTLLGAYGDALLIWYAPTTPDAVDVTVQALNPATAAPRTQTQVALRGERLTADSPQLIATPIGALMVFARQVAPDRSDLVAFSFACLR